MELRPSWTRDTKSLPNRKEDEERLDSRTYQLRAMDYLRHYFESVRVHNLSRVLYRRPTKELPKLEERRKE